MTSKNNSFQRRRDIYTPQSERFPPPLRPDRGNNVFPNAPLQTRRSSLYQENVAAAQGSKTFVNASRTGPYWSTVPRGVYTGTSRSQLSPRHGVRVAAASPAVVGEPPVAASEQPVSTQAHLWPTNFQQGAVLATGGAWALKQAYKAGQLQARSQQRLTHLGERIQDKWTSYTHRGAEGNAAVQPVGAPAQVRVGERAEATNTLGSRFRQWSTGMLRNRQSVPAEPVPWWAHYGVGGHQEANGGVPGARVGRCCFRCGRCLWATSRCCMEAGVVDCCGASIMGCLLCKTCC